MIKILLLIKIINNKFIKINNQSIANSFFPKALNAFPLLFQAYNIFGSIFNAWS